MCWAASPTAFIVERFFSLCALSKFVQGGFFLRKNPLRCTDSNLAWLENRCNAHLAHLPRALRG